MSKICSLKNGDLYTVFSGGIVYLIADNQLSVIGDLVHSIYLKYYMGMS